MSNAPSALPSDPRLIQGGSRLPLAFGYADQPYILTLADGTWLCLVTSADGHEGDPSQGVFSLRSPDKGRTWSKPIRLEPAGVPENSYAVGLVTPAGRAYAFYNFNSGNVRRVEREDGGSYARVDCLGDYVFRYSDDGGITWSAERYPVPIRPFHCDRTNIYGGKIRFFWNVGRPCVRAHGEVVIPHHKVGAMGDGFYAESEGAFLGSKNLLTESDPGKIAFETLPEGQHGLRTPPGGGRVAEEQSLVELSDGSLYCAYRSVDGWPVCSYSRDGGRTWEAPRYKTFTPGGRRMKHPRAANFVWKCSGGRYLYWFHNHGGEAIRRLSFHASLPKGAVPVKGRTPNDDRNPAWLCAGREVDGPTGRLLEWSQPEIVLYDDDPYTRISYPDLVEQEGRFWITETQKTLASVHEIPADLLEGLFGQFRPGPSSPDALRRGMRTGAGAWSVSMPALPLFNECDMKREDQRGIDHRSGLTLDLMVEDGRRPGDILFDSRNVEGAGLLVRARDDDSLDVELSDGRTVCCWPGDSGCLAKGRVHHVSIIVDGGPKLILFVVDGRLCDGGGERQFGWGRYNPDLRECNGAPTAAVHGAVSEVAIHGRALRVSEAVQNSRRTEAAPLALAEV